MWLGDRTWRLKAGSRLRRAAETHPGEREGSGGEGHREQWARGTSRSRWRLGAIFGAILGAILGGIMSSLPHIV